MSIADSQGLGRLSGLVKGLQASQLAIEEAEALLKECKETYAEFSEERIPDLMQELGLESIELSTGEKLKVENVFYAKIPSQRQEEAFKWLQDNGMGSVIKEEVIKKKGVHHQTLKAIVKERFEGGEPIPEELFGIYVKNVTKIK
jgi:hypothetical protein